MPPNDSGHFPGHPRSYREALADAIAELSATGYISEQRIRYWVDVIRRAAELEMGSGHAIDADTKAKMESIFARLIDRQKIAEYVPDVTRFGLSIARPQLRAELDRRIVAAVNQIKLDRREAVEKTLRRFSGWATSIPPGGDDTIDKRETRVSIGKSMAQLSFERRRCETDQGHKLIANISEIVATDSGAIAGIWHDHGEHDRSYNARKEHLARSGNLFLVRDSWAIEKGLIKRGSRPYMDEIERPGFLVSCRCFYQWITSPRRVPDECLTKKGQEFIAAGTARMAA